MTERKLATEIAQTLVRIGVGADQFRSVGDLEQGLAEANRILERA